MSLNGFRLSGREQQMLEFMADGWTTKEICRELKIAESTVDYQRQHLFEKLGAANAPHAVAIAFMHGWRSEEREQRIRDEARHSLLEELRTEISRGKHLWNI